MTQPTLLINNWSHVLHQPITPNPHLHSLPPTISASDQPVCGDSIMSGSVPPTQLPPQPSPPPPGFTQSQASVLGPGIAGLFIQGIETGLVLSQFSQWFAALDRSENSILTTIVIFVTVVGLYASSRPFTA